MSNLQAYNNSLELQATRADVVHELDDNTIKIIEADLIGALEGAEKAINYVVDKELSPSIAIAIVITSAITHGAARSQQAYHELRRPMYEKVSFDEGISTNSFQYPASLTIDQLREKVVRTSVCEQAVSNHWMYDVSIVDPFKFGPALQVAMKHNAILSVFDTVTNLPDINSQNGLYSIEELAYLSSNDYRTSFNKTVSSPFDFSDYVQIATPSTEHYKVQNIARLFLQAMNSYCNNSASFNQISDFYINEIDKSNELTDMEKQCLYMSLFVGKYSLRFWTEECPISDNQ